ncbi:MAG: T9SS type A sorting domain-containing protein, partial [candidate division Zixibacteria bacterium]|nr:T9SS type A sorting domain-containing protein [candidate division Zixibacteria bacterium]
MMQKRAIFSSLLLVSLLSLVSTSSTFAQSNTVTVGSAQALRCANGTINVTVDNLTAISAFEIVLDWSGAGTITSVTFDPSLGNLTTRNVDVTANQIRIIALDLTGGSDCLGAGSHIVAQINFTTDSVCSDSITFAGGTFSCQTNNVTTQTQFVDCQTTTLVSASVQSGSVTINNAPPSVTCPLNVTMHFGDIVQVNASATDADLANPCEALTYSLGATSPGYAAIGSSSGQITLTPQGSDVCVSTVEVIVTDACGAADTCYFDVCVQNTPPIVTCPSEINRICWGQEATGQVTATDPDNGPLTLQYSVLSFDGPGAMSIDPNSGVYTWQTDETDPFISPDSGWTLCVVVTDNANLCDPCSPENADTCCLPILVVPTYRVCIENRGDGEDVVIIGQNVDVCILLDDTYENYEMGGWDFLFEYDASVMSILGASPGGFYTGNNWEYFTFRFGPDGNCGTGCPSGKFRVIAIAETNDKFNHPSGYTNRSGDPASSVLLCLHFLLTQDRNVSCQHAAIRWCWYDCGDNTISSVSGDSLFISRYIYQPVENNYPWNDGGAASVHNNNGAFPNFTGAPDLCLTDTSETVNKRVPLRKIDFKNGGIKITCDKDIDDRGDLNLNGLAAEVADVVVYTSYFIEGLSAFRLGVDAQTAASDVNADGIPLTVADLVLLIRIVVGDAQLIPSKLVHYANTVTIQTQGSTISFLSSDNIEMGAALFVFEGTAEVELLQSDLRLETGVREGNTYALVLPKLENIENATGVLSIQTGAILSSASELISVEAADFNGAALNVATKVIPTNFALSQNYPNPFNPSTKIGIDLPVASDYVITIYNVNGQKVDVISGSAIEGTHIVEWSPNGLASGIYFYKLEAGSYTATKKMAFLK